jgi:hypothetical protein
MRNIKSLSILFFLSVFLINPAFAAEMVSNLGESNGDYYGVDYDGPEAQRFTTDGFSYQLTSVTIEIVPMDDSDDSGNFTLRIFNDDNGYPGNMLSNGLLNGPGNPSIGEHTYTASGIINLSPNTRYWIVAQVSSGDGDYGLSFTSSTSQSGAWSIMDNEAYSGDAGSSWDYDSNVMRISISADLADSPASIPTLNEWGVIIFSLLLGSVAIWYMRKKGHGGSMA